MKNKLTVILFFALIFEFFIIESCNDKEEKPSTPTIDENSLVIKGSDSEFEIVKKMLHEFQKDHPKIKTNIKGGGSAKGIESLIEGDANIANSSRPLNSEEWEWAEENDVHPVPVIFAIDAVAFITHPEVGVDSLSPTQLQAIFSGKVKNWKELGGTDIPIVLTGRNHSSGTHDYILSRLHLTNWDKTILRLESNLDIYSYVKSNKGAIGYVSLGTLVSYNGKPVNDVWAINIYTDYSSAVSPYEINKVQNGDYYFSRPLYQYVNNLPSELVLKFIHFMLSEKVQKQLWENGYFPLTENHIKLNQENKIFSK